MPGEEAHSAPILPYTFVREHGLVLLSCEGETAQVGIRGALRALPLMEVRRVAGRPLKTVRLDGRDFDRHVSEIYALRQLDEADLEEDGNSEGLLSSILDEMPRVADLLDADDDAPVIRLINGMIAEAAKTGASDIHIEPFAETLSVRFRKDGVLAEVASLPARMAGVLVSRLKVMGRLDIAEKRLPQDGRISVRIGSAGLDVRLSTLPSSHGERAVLRLLDNSQQQFGLDRIGMPREIEQGFRSALREPNGIILVTGPTGSGKTTTLYAGLDLLNDRTRNILTVEDPVEYALEGVGQTQVNAKVGMTFSAGLRAILRQDPDVVMVGEIRDSETADIAIQASLTGHLVLSTVHTNNAASAVTRLRDLGVEPFLLSATLRGILAQRLVRRLCSACKRPVGRGELPPSSLTEGMGADAELFEPGGCLSCGETGYRGRFGVFEWLPVDADIRHLVQQDAGEAALVRHSFGGGGRLADHAAHLVRTGETSLSEVIRVCGEEL